MNNKQLKAVSAVAVAGIAIYLLMHKKPVAVSSKSSAVRAYTPPPKSPPNVAKSWGAPPPPNVAKSWGDPAAAAAAAQATAAAEKAAAMASQMATNVLPTVDAVGPAPSGPSSDASYSINTGGSASASFNFGF